MSKLPIESTEKTSFIQELAQSHHTLLKDWCSRNGTTVAATVRKLIYDHLDACLEKDLSPGNNLFTAGEIALDIWRPDPSLNKGNPSVRPTCVLCGHEQAYRDPNSPEMCDDGYVHYWMKTRTQAKCYCLKCLLAFAVKNTNLANMSQREQFEAAYSINSIYLEHHLVGKTLFQRLLSAKRAFFQNVPELENCSDKEVLDCYKDVSKRGLLESSAFYKRFGTENVVNNESAIVYDYEDGTQHKPSEMMFIRFKGDKLYGFLTSRLVQQGREILSNPLRAAFTVKLAHNLTFDAYELGMAKKCPQMDATSFRARLVTEAVPVEALREDALAKARQKLGAFWKNASNGSIKRGHNAPDGKPEGESIWDKLSDRDATHIAVNISGQTFEVVDSETGCNVEVKCWDYYDIRLEKVQF